MQLSLLDKINYGNVALIVISTAIAIFFPFELFLFSYAILGPLHYLTEIGWLHDKQYYTKKKYDFSLLVALSLLIALPVIGLLLHFKTGISSEQINQFMYIAVVAAIIFVFVEKPIYRIVGFALAILTLKFSNNFYLVLSVFLPTLIHVFIFTALFMLYGALKTKSKSGYISFWTMILFPVIIIYIFSGYTSYTISDYGFNAYKSFEAINFFSLKNFSTINTSTNETITQGIYFSKAGIILMRFIAFAYTYHYLNWFSKTEVIKWHKVPKRRLLIIVILWLISIAAYAFDYKTGFQCLFFLSFLHVLLELPLNIISIKGIFSELFNSSTKKVLIK
ncbi:MAG: hypothetical protein Q7W45_02745 [Bacteroidota bacterium]|nr:hypothetical protein [Bacteroidota bacterium]MDP3145828.1 hypothetical protein [Bacteroidota bacterium]MDP3558462.1 hypothetical protein [Bacteroidota bacterium]